MTHLIISASDYTNCWHSTHTHTTFAVAPALTFTPTPIPTPTPSPLHLLPLPLPLHPYSQSCAHIHSIPATLTQLSLFYSRLCNIQYLLISVWDVLTAALAWSSKDWQNHQCYASTDKVFTLPHQFLVDSPGIPGIPKESREWTRNRQGIFGLRNSLKFPCVSPCSFLVHSQFWVLEQGMNKEYSPGILQEWPVHSGSFLTRN